VAVADELGSTGYPVKDLSHRYLVTPIESLAVAVEQLVNPSVIEAHPNRLTGAPWSATWAVLTGTDDASAR
jgi:hypothetical protein